MRQDWMGIDFGTAVWDRMRELADVFCRQGNRFCARRPTGTPSPTRTLYGSPATGTMLMYICASVKGPKFGGRRPNWAAFFGWFGEITQTPGPGFSLQGQFRISLTQERGQLDPSGRGFGARKEVERRELASGGWHRGCRRRAAARGEGLRAGKGVRRRGTEIGFRRQGDQVVKVTLWHN